MRPRECSTNCSATTPYNHPTMSQLANPSPAPSSVPDWVAITREKVESLRFGVVQLLVHDGRVTQIERTEKTRLPSYPDTPVVR